MDVKMLTGTMGQDEFYPTPKTIVEKMLDGIKKKKVRTILEPSAGKGDILDGLWDMKIEYGNRFFNAFEKDKMDIDCIEIDSNLQHILKGKGYRVVHDNFLTYHTYKKYDLILMNPPFSNGDKHLAKALQMQKGGGGIVCLLNAETIKNPYSNLRKELVKMLADYDAEIEYVQDGFVDSERTTNVEIAIIKVWIPQKKEESEIYERMKKATQYEEFHVDSGTEIVLNDYIKAAVAQFNIEVASGVELIRQYWNLCPYISSGFNGEAPLIKLNIGGENSNISINKYLESVRLKYWNALFNNEKFTSNFTSSLIYEYHNMINNLKDYDFSEHNINMIMLDMSSKMSKNIEETIMQMFDRLSCEHSWYKESANNIHYYSGWATNKAHKINKKVILPCYGVFSEWDKTLRTYKAHDTLKDIEKIFNFFDGNMTAPVDLRKVIEESQHNPKNIKCKYFTVTFYKKGTVHITFNNLDLLEKFNIYAAKNRCWLPPDYGKKQYKDMNQEEKAVVDDFQGEEAYKKVMERQDYYLVETQDMLMLGC